MNIFLVLVAESDALRTYQKKERKKVTRCTYIVMSL
jgi:hypothetical protein